MNKADESELIGKMMHDANRRKIQHEKIQRAKFEAELREVYCPNETLLTIFRLKNL